MHKQLWILNTLQLWCAYSMRALSRRKKIALSGWAVLKGCTCIFLGCAL